MPIFVTLEIIVFFASVMDRHASIVPILYEETTSFGPTAWPNFIFNGTALDSSSGAGDRECATICGLHNPPCELFYTSASVCYMGRFDVNDGTVLAPPVAGPFHQVQGSYSESQFSRKRKRVQLSQT